MVIWITGISGSGKTTLCEELHARLKPSISELVVLDGDLIRAAFGDDLGYAESDRVRQITRIQNIARLLSDQGLIVLVAALYANPDLLAWNRRHINGYFEVYLRVSLDTVRGRDPKGLYAKFDCGELREVVGLDIPWHEPERPDLFIDADYPQKPEVTVNQILAAVSSRDERLQRA